MRSLVCGVYMCVRRRSAVNSTTTPWMRNDTAKNLPTHLGILKRKCIEKDDEEEEEEEEIDVEKCEHFFFCLFGRAPGQGLSFVLVLIIPISHKYIYIYLFFLPPYFLVLLPISVSLHASLYIYIYILYKLKYINCPLSSLLKHLNIVSLQKTLVCCPVVAWVTWPLYPKEHHVSVW